MKTLVLALIVILSTVTGFAQGTVVFSNTVPTAVTNALTGQGVTSSGSNIFKVTLYYAVDGVTDESSFIPLGAPGTFTPPGAQYAPGLFGWGIRTTPTNTPPGGYAMFQVRAWEFAYGSNYEIAVQAPAMNGRRALVGKSVIMRVKTGGAASFLFGTNASPSLNPFLMDVAGDPQPELSVNDVLTFEGDAGVTSAVFTVAISYPNTNVVSVDFATSDGTAVAGADYPSTNGTIVFNPGEVSKTVAVTVLGDTLSENDEWFWLNLNNATNAVIRRGVGKGTIYNDDCRTSLSAALFTGVTLNGCVGKPYRIEAADIHATNSWFTVTNFVLPSSPFTWVDFTSSSTQQRFYRAILLAP